MDGLVDDATGRRFAYRHGDLIREWVTRTLLDDVPDEVPASDLSAHVAATMVAWCVRGWAEHIGEDPLDLWREASPLILNEERRPT